MILSRENVLGGNVHQDSHGAALWFAKPNSHNPKSRISAKIQTQKDILLKSEQRDSGLADRVKPTSGVEIPIYIWKYALDLF